ncbi:hypothetical protein ACF09C_06000 [Streptomyces sp. NPDC014870]|uniref:hypothetical protein n=1 Tax=Streptomyces sp. NPDC014870 TaxID=3364925 RepID=UPI0036F7B216
MLAAVIGALLLSAVLCFAPLGDTAHPWAERSTATASTLAVDLQVAPPDGGFPQHPRHHHGGGGCTAPGLMADAHLLPRQAPDAATSAPAATSAMAIDDGPASPAERGERPPHGRAAMAEPGRSTQIRVCRWRV